MVGRLHEHGHSSEPVRYESVPWSSRLWLDTTRYRSVSKDSPSPRRQDIRFTFGTNESTQTHRDSSGDEFCKTTKYHETCVSKR